MSLLVIVLILICILLFFIAVGLSVAVWQTRTASSTAGPADTCARTQPVRIGRRPGGQGAFNLSLHLTPPRLLVMCAGSMLAAAFLGVAINRGNTDLQMFELQGYARLARLPSHVDQVDLDGYQSFSQYEPQIVSPQAGNFGANACGLIAPAQAVVLTNNPSLAGTQQGFNTIFTLMSGIRAEAFRADGRAAYTGSTGVQPSDLARAVQASPIGSQWQVKAQNGWTLVRLYQSLLDERIVIVDLRLQKGSEIPSTEPETIAHYARVLGMDIDRGEIYIENTVDRKDGRSYWTLPLADFMEVWSYPETQATVKPSRVDPSIREENVTRWALVMERK